MWDVTCVLLRKVSKIGTSFIREKVFTSIVRVTVNLEVVGQFALFHNRSHVLIGKISGKALREQNLA